MQRAFKNFLFLWKWVWGQIEVRFIFNTWIDTRRVYHNIIEVNNDVPFGVISLFVIDSLFSTYVYGGKRAFVFADVPSQIEKLKINYFSLRKTKFKTDWKRNWYFMFWLGAELLKWNFLIFFKCDLYFDLWSPVEKSKMVFNKIFQIDICSNWMSFWLAITAF